MEGEKRGVALHPKVILLITALVTIVIWGSIFISFLIISEKYFPGLDDAPEWTVELAIIGSIALLGFIGFLVHKFFNFYLGAKMGKGDNDGKI